MQAALLPGTDDASSPFFSPDGRWLAYISNESGRFEVYVRPFPGPGARWQISPSGGNSPIWSPTKHELFYRTYDGYIMVAAFRVEGDSFSAEKPRLWSAERISTNAGADGRFRVLGGFDLHPDGERFALVADAQNTAKQDHVTFIFNFFDELRRIAPPGGRQP